MTHVPEKSAAQMFELLVRSLYRGGVAIWTIHGRHVDHIYPSGTWLYKLSEERLGRVVETFRAGRCAYSDYEHISG